MAGLEKLLSAEKPWLADGGLETVMIYDEGLDLPHFAAFTLLDSDAGRDALSRYFRRFAGLARKAGTGFVLDTPTWRAGTTWGAVMGLDAAEVRRINLEAGRFGHALRTALEQDGTDTVLNGVIGPSGDGYALDRALSGTEAQARHQPQMDALADAGVELVTAVTMTHSGEAVGIARAAIAAGMPVAVSFTVETDGRLPSGETLADAIAATDDTTGNAPLYYMINCAHPTHFMDVLAGDWVARIGGVRANASRMSHAELDVATELDAGDPDEFGRLYRDLGALLPGLRVVGGCCGSDHRHVGAASRHLHQPVA
ncbi:MAG: homocysteine S-methyltransferase family protein [Tabrizicola sp.]|uniref:homocysteine S-methyltransferase family protein n=1 Tax=Tabrizicola sp. TaxID=2005166 RepID=UPI002735248B|nr:homocysteine S-methyltransferase family protein [Tabrizicola sp.]MDP3263316.1 homocysteine S-methyltransferase family protein [Tabrizicola sp.]MDP3646673.1 homocysteine S-methyltransferase family protein [Paracoccaceae bacterium]MDZ4068203.1 homocysteine S-methyltransferase family protein [Tabrizicola sp.]